MAGHWPIRPLRALHHSTAPPVLRHLWSPEIESPPSIRRGAAARRHTKRPAIGQTEARADRHAGSGLWRAPCGLPSPSTPRHHRLSRCRAPGATIEVANPQTPRHCTHAQGRRHAPPSQTRKAPKLHRPGVRVIARSGHHHPPVAWSSERAEAEEKPGAKPLHRLEAERQLFSHAVGQVHIR